MKPIIVWTLSILLALAFLGAGFAKLTAQPMMVTEFQGFNYPLWFMTLTGVLEIIGAVSLLVPRAALAGAGLLACVLVGALFSHLTHDQAGMIGLPLGLLILVVAVGWLRASPGQQAVTA
jgi:putative oxidoreductase